MNAKIIKCKPRIHLRLRLRRTSRRTSSLQAEELILDKLNTQKEPMHIMEGVLNNNKFTYTADDGLYEGSGELSKDVFEGYYKGPVDGTYKMWRIE